MEIKRSYTFGQQTIHVIFRDAETIKKFMQEVFGYDKRMVEKETRSRKSKTKNTKKKTQKKYGRRRSYTKKTHHLRGKRR